MGEGKRRRRRMEGGERKGWWGHSGGLTACEYGLTSWVRLQVFSTGLEKTKIKPRNVNLFPIVSAEKSEIERAYIYISSETGTKLTRKSKCKPQTYTGNRDVVVFSWFFPTQ